MQIYKIIKEKDKRLALYFIALLYLIVLFAVEYIGYNLINIQLASDYPSLLGLGILHGPIGMKAFYLGAGPVYIIVSEYLLGSFKNN